MARTSAERANAIQPGVSKRFVVVVAFRNANAAEIRFLRRVAVARDIKNLARYAERSWHRLLAERDAGISAGTVSLCVRVSLCMFVCF